MAGTASVSAADPGYYSHLPPALVKEESEERSYGFWLYLMSDGVIFSLLFVVYATMRHNLAGEPGGAQLFEMDRVIAETAVLLISSITFGFASVAAMRRQKGQVVFWMLVTGALGLTFLYLEISEFAAMIEQGAGPDRSGFLSAFFVLVGTHGLHVTVGLVWMAVMLVQLATKGLTARVTSRLERLGTFWHFLDIVWIGIFSIVYLPGIMQ